MMVSFSAMSTFPLNSPYLSISLYNESNFCDFLVCATLSFAVSLVCLQEISPVKINRVKNVFFIYVFIFNFLIGYNVLGLCEVAENRRRRFRFSATSQKPISIC